MILLFVPLVLALGVVLVLFRGSDLVGVVFVIDRHLVVRNRCKLLCMLLVFFSCIPSVRTSMNIFVKIIFLSFFVCEK